MLSKQPDSFASDLDFLKEHGEVLLLSDRRGARIAVSAQYQGRVMTSAVSAVGRSLGWVNRAFIQAGKVGTPFDNYGGEDRFWLGPEGGQYAVFFPKGASFELASWQTPRGVQEGAWEVARSDEASVEFRRDLQLESRAGARFEVGVERRVALLHDVDVAELAGALPAGVEYVAFASDNRITNTGRKPWSEETGLISIWSLGMFVPADDTWVIAPFEQAASGPVVNSGYFGELGRDRLRVDDTHGAVWFLADGRYRSKIGLTQSRSKMVAGSYTASEDRLTIIGYSRPSSPQPYVNSTWQEQAEPFAGDLFNAYNHGTLTPGPLAPGDVRFYELESSSPGAVLAPGETLRHEHQTFHFVGPRPELDAIARRVLGTPLSLAGGGEAG